MDDARKDLLRKSALRAIRYLKFGDPIDYSKLEDLRKGCEEVGYKKLAYKLQEAIEERNKKMAQEAQKKKRLYDFVNQGVKGREAVYHRVCPAMDIRVTIEEIDPEKILLVVKNVDPPRRKYHVNPLLVDLL